MRWMRVCFTMLMADCAIAPSAATQPVDLASRAQVLTQVMLERSSFLGERVPWDGCFLYNMLDKRADYLALIGEAQRDMVRRHVPEPCSPEPWDVDSTLMADEITALIVRTIPIYVWPASISRDSGALIVKLQITRNRQAFLETYTLRSLPDVPGQQSRWYVAELTVRRVH
jgi:hypothetical protein